jgi:hypothetical protein
MENKINIVNYAPCIQQNYKINIVNYAPCIKKRTTR